MAKFKVEIDSETCIGCGACTATCADTFEMHDTANGQKAQVKKADLDVIGCANEAAEVCPVNCIHISEDGKKII